VYKVQYFVDTINQQVSQQIISYIDLFELSEMLIIIEFEQKIILT